MKTIQPFIVTLCVITATAAIAGEKPKAEKQPSLETGLKDSGQTRQTVNVPATLAVAKAKRAAATAKSERDYRVAVAGMFPFADRVEVFLLDSTIGRDSAFKLQQDDERFHIRPLMKKTKVLKKATVPAEKIKTWCDAVAKVITSDKVAEEEPRHSPLYGIRIHARGELLFETSFSWHSETYFVGNRFERFEEKEVGDLKKLCFELVPLPEGNRGAIVVEPEDQ